MGANLILPAGSAAADSTPADPVTRSLRFDGSAYLSRSTGSTSTTWTLAFWVKRATISGPSQAQYLATWGISGSAGEGLSFRGTTDSSNTDKLGFWNGSSTTYSTGVYRDPAGWAHICISVNSGTATVYYNGESILSGITGVQAWGSMRLGAWLNQNELEGYIADVYGVEGSALDHTSFTESNDYGGLKPKAFTGVGTNGFHLLFENTSSIGEDDAGSNDFTASGLASADIREDNPFKNHATWNPLIKRSSTSNIFTYSEGNTVATYTGGVAHTSTTIASSGVHYAEFAFSGGTSSISGAGVVRARWNDGHADSYTTNYGGCYYGSSGNVDSPSGSTSVSAVGSNRLGIAFDGANNKADFYSVTSGGTMTLLKSLTSSDSIDFDGSATFTATSHDTGATSITGYFEAGEWWGTAPSVGSTTATSLNTSNLGTPTVNPEEHFLPATYTGAGGSEEINLGFTPALTWIKRREDSGYWHGFYDSVRGLSAGALASNSTNTEDSTQRVASFDSDTGSEGFTLASSHYSYTNTSGKDFISWNWKAHQGGPVTRSHTMTLEVDDLWGSGSDWGNTKLEVWEGATKLKDITQPAYTGGSSTAWTIKTNDTDKIKVVWDVDSSMDWTAMYAILKDSSNNTLASWNGNNYDGYSSTPADGSNFYIPSSHDSSNAAVTGVVESSSPTVESYNSAAAFTIITYGGNGSDGDTQDLTHSLGAEPEFIITKARTDSNSADGGWNVYHKDTVLGTNYYNGTHPLLWLNRTWDSYDPINSPAIPKSGSENTTITVNNDSSYGHAANDSGATYVMYAWAGVESYSSFGKYTGNGSSDGPMVHLSFRPKFFMYKQSTGTTNWVIVDAERETYNTVDLGLFPNLSTYEQAGSSSNYKMDFLSNGVKIRTSVSGTNANNQTFIYAAFAESPFKHANAR
jgi:hypothetical protein